MFKKNFFQVSSNSPYDLISQINLERVCHRLMKKSFKAVLRQENLNQALFLKLYYWFRLRVFIKTIPWVLFHALNRRPGNRRPHLGWRCCLFCLFFLVMYSLILQPLTVMILKKLEDIFGALTINHSKHISAVHFHSPPSYFTDGGVREQRQGS